MPTKKKSRQELIQSRKKRLDTKEIGVLLKWEITDKMVSKWKKLNQTKQCKEYDCVVNSLSFFNIIDTDMAKDLSNKTIFREDGIFTEQIKYLLKNYYDKLHKTQHTHIITNTINLTIPRGRNVEFIRNSLGKAYGTIFGLHKNDGEGHMLIYATDNDGNPYLIDPQTEMMYSEEHVEMFLSLYTHLQYFKIDNSYSSYSPKPGNLHKRKKGSITPTPSINNEIQKRRKLKAKTVKKSKTESKSRKTKKQRTKYNNIDNDIDSLANKIKKLRIT